MREMEADEQVKGEGIQSSFSFTVHGFFYSMTCCGVSCSVLEIFTADARPRVGKLFPLWATVGCKI